MDNHIMLKVPTKAKQEFKEAVVRAGLRLVTGQDDPVVLYECWEAGKCYPELPRAAAWVFPLWPQEWERFVAKGDDLWPFEAWEVRGVEHRDGFTGEYPVAVVWRVNEEAAYQQCLRLCLKTRWGSLGEFAGRAARVMLSQGAHVGERVVCSEDD